MYRQELLAESTAQVQRFLSSNYFASENLAVDKTSSSLTWERIHAGYAPVGILAFVDNAMTNTRRRATMVSCDTVISTLDDAMISLAADTTATNCVLEREVVGEELIVDAEVLETLQPRTKEQPEAFVALKHVTYRSAVDLGNGASGEDYVLTETIGRDVDPDGFRFGYKMLRSVDLPGVFCHVDARSKRSSVPEAYDENHTRRGNIHTFMLILSETKFTGVLRMQLWLDVDLPTDNNGAAIVMDSSFAALHDSLSLGLRYRRLIERSFSAAVKRDPSSSISAFANVNLLPMMRMRVSNCQVCERKLGLFSRKRHSCDVCKVSLCGTCAKSTEMCTWRLCACCYGRNHGLFSRQIMAKLTSSPFSRISFFARRNSTFSRRQSIVASRSVRRISKANGPPLAATITPYQKPIVMNESRRTSSSDSSKSTATSSNPATSESSLSSTGSRFQPSVGELIQIEEADDDHDGYATITSYTDPLPLDGVKLLDEQSLLRFSGSLLPWEKGADDADVDQYLEMLAQEEDDVAGTMRTSMVRESFSRESFSRPSFQRGSLSLQVL